MEKAIATVMLTVAGIAAIVAVLNALMPAVYRTSGSLVASADSVDGRIGTQIEIVHATGSAGSPTVEAWTKISAASPSPRSHALTSSSGRRTTSSVFPTAKRGCVAPCWYATLENDTVWNPTATLKITVEVEDDLVTDTTYYIKIVTPNGISDARFFTV